MIEARLLNKPLWWLKNSSPLLSKLNYLRKVAVLLPMRKLKGSLMQPILVNVSYILEWMIDVDLVDVVAAFLLKLIFDGFGDVGLLFLIAR